MKAFLGVGLLLIMAARVAAQPASSAHDAAMITGVVGDVSGAVLPGALVTVRTAGSRVVVTQSTDGAGRFRAQMAPGTYTVEIGWPNFATRRYASVTLAAGETRVLDTTLALTLTADVTVTAKRTFRNLAELDSAADGLFGVADNASEGLVTGQQLDARPIMRTGDVLEAIPGLVISQHSGEGKANQYYLRGFNLDHGTDFATSIAGVPVNLPSHAHGQGYSDVNFLIPELVGTVQFQKGLYSAEHGDFSTAGASQIRYVNALDRPIARLSVGGDGWRRAFAAASPRVGSGTLLVAGEGAHNDGPWVRPDDYEKTNAVVRYSRGDLQNGVALTGMFYRGQWNATDQAPARAIADGSLPRFDGVDPTTGGDTTRASLSADWQQSRAGTVTRANAYLVRYKLNLFSNFTYYLGDPVNGDQFEQADRRWISGGRVTHRRLGTLAGRPAELVLGADIRRDDIGHVGLYHTAARRRLSAIREDAVDESSLGVFAQHEVQWTPWLRTGAGVRGDRYWFDVRASDPRNTGAAAAGLISPKGSIVLGPWRNNEVYVSAGTGFHSNDARGTTMTVDPLSGEPVDPVTPVTRARGAEVGLRSMPFRGFQFTLAGWTLALDSELVFVGDAGTTEAGRPSRRSGLEVAAYYAPRSWLAFDADLAFSNGRFSDVDPAGDRIPGALGRVAAAGVTIHDRGRFGGSVRLRHFGPRDLIEDGSVQSRATTLVNGQVVLGLTARTKVVLDAFNLFDSKASDIDYFYRSRLPSEPLDGVDDLHTHPALPRTVRIGVQVGW